MRWIAVWFLFVLTISFVILMPSDSPKVTKEVFRLSDYKIIGYDPLDNMPIVDGGYGEVFQSAFPIEQRDAQFRPFLAASVKIGLSGSSGSGTICYYDPRTNTAYVATCGHLWSSGVMTVEQGAQRKMTCKVIIWYQNEKKLTTTKEYKANVIFYSHVSGADTGLITFQPDWVPNYFPIAPVNYDIRQGTRQHSLGCDGGREVAHYDVEIVGMQGNNLITRYNSPRPGRSGGGLLSDDNYYIGTCWGTSQRDGSGIGYFTPLHIIHRFWGQQKGYEWLLTQRPNSGAAARLLPIFDRLNPSQKYAEDYILLPGR